MTLPPATRSEIQTAPPDKRANPQGIPVRLQDGTLVAHINSDLAHEIVETGAAEAFRSGSRRYLRLQRGIVIPRPEPGWDVIEFLRKWHGDKRAAEYVSHSDRQSERLKYQPGSLTPVRTPRRRIE